MFNTALLNLKANRNIAVLLWLLLVSYCILRALYYCNSTPGGGDESIFMEANQRIRELGWIAATQSQFPATYALLTYPVSFIFEDYIAIRVTNALLLFIFGLYIYKRFPQREVWFYGAFYLFTTSFLTGTNDALFQLALSVFLLETLLFLTQQKFNAAIAFSGLIVAAFTREMFVVFIPAILLAVFVLWRRKFSAKEFILPIAVLLALTTLHWPSFSAHGKPSYDQKLPPAGYEANWAERQYLSQLMVNEGKLPHGQHVKWQEVVDYKKEHGESSLPDSMGAGALLDPMLTAKEFFKNFAEMVSSSMRQTGLIQLYCIVAFFVLLFRREDLRNLYVPAAVVITFSVFSLIITYYVEMRWLVPVSILACAYFGHMEHYCQDTRFRKLFLLNYALLALVMCYGNYKILTSFI